MKNEKTFTFVILSILTLVLVLSCGNKRGVSGNVYNAKEFFSTLTKDGGNWVYRPNDSSISFTNFIMKFQMQGNDTLIGRISGVHENGDTIPFWNVKEIINYNNSEIIFEQTGSIGKAKSISTFPKPSVRKSEFEIFYVNGTKAKHMDIHRFLSQNEMLAESDIYDSEKREWVKQPSTIWERLLIKD